MRTRIISAAFISTLFGLAISASVNAATPSEQSFASPDKAVEALVGAAQDSDPSKLFEIFGSQGKEVFSSGDPVADKRGRLAFVNRYNEQHSLEDEGGNKILLIGSEGWPFPVPLVEKNGSWKFNIAEGKEEILNRRIGGNEMGAIDFCHKYVDAQKAYYSRDRDGDGFQEYSRYFVSPPGKRTGLFWTRKPGEGPSPLGPLAAQAFAEGYLRDVAGNELTRKPQPYHGYYFRILEEQGVAADGGRKSYVEKSGRMTGGFALVAYPARWGVSGIMSFIVNQDGKVFEKNLGAQTEKLGPAMKSYNPDSSWKLAQ
jgi:hypothetical protein